MVTNEIKKYFILNKEVYIPYFSLFKLKFSPFNVKKSKTFFYLNLFFYYLIELFFIESNMVDFIKACFQVLFETGFTYLFVIIILFLNNSKHNFYQLGTAILLCENIAALIVVIIYYIFNFSSTSSLIIAIIIVFIWDMIFITNILKNTLSIEKYPSFFIFIMYFLTTYGGSYEVIHILSYFISTV
jgi:hypothetical protein